MIVFTICSANFMSYALTLKESIEKYNEVSAFYLLMCDRKGTIDDNMFDFEIIYIEDLGIPGIDDMINHYNITELNTSAKPFMFLYMFDRHPGENIIYFDPDVMIFSPLEELIYQINLKRNCILTPHITEPAEFAEMNDGMFLKYGIYNLGFCSLRDCPQVRRVVSWWARRLEKECIIDLSRGLFVDQKWADLLPAMIDDTYILRHPGYNAAYWNLSQRRVSINDSTWNINGSKLRFFHFSGNIIENKSIFSRHSHQFNIDTFGCIGNMLDIYRDKIMKNGHEYYRSLEYGFSWSGISGVNEHTRYEINKNRGKSSKNPHLYMRNDISNSETPSQIIEARSLIEKKIINGSYDFADREIYCSVCGKNTFFNIKEDLNKSKLLQCIDCGFDAKFRAAFHVALQSATDANTTILVDGQANEKINSYFVERTKNLPCIGHSQILIIYSQKLLDNIENIKKAIFNNDIIIIIYDENNSKFFEMLGYGRQITELSCWSRKYGYMFEKIKIIIVD